MFISCPVDLYYVAWRGDGRATTSGPDMERREGGRDYEISSVRYSSVQ